MEIALGHPAYVLRINAEKNTVMLGDAEELKAEYMLVEDYHITVNAGIYYNARTCQYVSAIAASPIPCQVLVLDGKTTIGPFPFRSIRHRSRTISRFFTRGNEY